MTIKTPIAELSLDAAAVRRAFEAGVAYHDALMAHSAQAPGARNTVVEGSERLNSLFETWHNTIAEVLGVEP